MTTSITTTTAPPVEAAAPEPRATMRYRVTPMRVLKSEFLRFVTLRTNVIMTVSLGVVMALVGVIAAASSTGTIESVGPGGGPRGGGSPIGIVLAGATPAVLLVGILGVLVGAREYGSGMIRTTMSAVPGRIAVLIGRITVFALIVTPVAVLGAVLAFQFGSDVLRNGDAAYAQWSDAGVPRAVFGTGVYLACIGVLGLCLGILTRSIAQGIGWVIGLVVVFPQFGVLLLPDDWEDSLDYLPSMAGNTWTSVSDTGSTLSVTQGGFVVLAWVVVMSVAAGISLLRRDV